MSRRHGSTVSRNRAARHAPKLQSAMEYLLTYGWAILIIAIIMVVLATLGIFNGNGGASSCLPNSGYLCTSVVLTNGGLMYVTFGEIGQQITITGTNCSTETSGAPSIQPISPVSVYSGQQVNLSFVCPLSSYNLGTRFGGKLWIEYTSGVQSGLEAQVATVEAKVSSYGSCQVTVDSYVAYNSVPFNGVINYVMYGGGGGGGGGGNGGNGQSTSGSFPIAYSGNLLIIIGGGGGGGGYYGGGGGGSGWYGGGGGDSTYEGGGGGGGSSVIMLNNAPEAYAPGGNGGTGYGTAGGGSTSGGSGASGGGGVDYSVGSSGSHAAGGAGGNCAGNGGTGSSGGSGCGLGGGGGGGYGSQGGSGTGGYDGAGGSSSGSGGSGTAGLSNGPYGASPGTGGHATLTWAEVGGCAI